MLCWVFLTHGQPPAALSESPVITEYLLTLDQDLTLFLGDDPVGPDAYTYLRPLEGIQQEGTWLLVPFLPETFGIGRESEHLVFKYLQSEKRQVNKQHTLPLVFLIEDFMACSTLHKRIKTHLRITSKN
jgi:hypothetical protein